jgi:hypothetical protein
MTSITKVGLARLVLANEINENTGSSAREIDVVVGPISIPREVSIDSHIDRNPGIGGSEFYSLQLALLLRDAGYKVALEVYGVLPELVGISRVQRDVLLHETGGVRVVSTAVAFSISDALPENQSMILVSHHPHDGWLASLLKSKLSVAAVVNVGRYQYFSNRTRKVWNLWLPAFTPTPSLKVAQGGSELGYRAGHISSFHPSKGFHTIAKGWMRYVDHPNSADQAKMQVIGADTLYTGGGEKNDRFQFPISGTYADRIRRVLSKSNQDWKNHVKFEGLVPESPTGLIQGWEVAICSPLGLSEADPIVIQDAFSVSTPVIAGTLFGLYDYMRFFPELSAHTSYGISKRLRQLDEDPILRRSMQLRVDDLYLQLLERRKRMEVLWAEVISNVIKGEPLTGLEVGVKEPALWCRLQLGVLLLALQSVASRILRIAKGPKEF